MFGCLINIFLRSHTHTSNQEWQGRVKQGNRESKVGWSQSQDELRVVKAQLLRQEMESVVTRSSHAHS